MAAYRQLAAAQTVEDSRAAVESIRDRYGPLPEPVQLLAEVVRLRALARRGGVASISQERTGILFRLADPSTTGDRMRVLSAAWRGGIDLTPDGILLRADGGGLAETIRRVGDLLDALAAQASAAARGGVPWAQMAVLVRRPAQTRQAYRRVRRRESSPIGTRWCAAWFGFWWESGW